MLSGLGVSEVAFWLPYSFGGALGPLSQPSSIQHLYRQPDEPEQSPDDPVQPSCVVKDLGPKRLWLKTSISSSACTFLQTCDFFNASLEAPGARGDSNL